MEIYQEFCLRVVWFWTLSLYLPALCPISSSPTVATSVFFIVGSIDLVIFCHSRFSLPVGETAKQHFPLSLLFKRICCSLKIFFGWFVSNQILSSPLCWVWNCLLPTHRQQLDLAPVRLQAKGLLSWESHCPLAWSDHWGGNLRFCGTRKRRAKEIQWLPARGRENWVIQGTPRPVGPDALLELNWRYCSKNKTSLRRSWSKMGREKTGASCRSHIARVR